MNLGILGCGEIAKKMALAVKTLEGRGKNVVAYGVASRCEEKGKKFAAEYGFVKSFGSYEELANDPNVDLIYIATPHSEHYENALLCVNRGKNILVEKAFTANALQASELIALAEEKGVFLCEAMWTRFLPEMKVLKDWIKSGKIGKVSHLEAEFSIPLVHVDRLVNPNLAGGALLDLGIYCLTFADLIFNDAEIGGACNGIESQESRSILFETGVDGTDFIELKFRNGQKAVLKTSMVLPYKNEGLIYGDKGFIKVFNLNDFEKLECYDLQGHLMESIKLEKIANGYEYEVLACEKAISNKNEFCVKSPYVENGFIWECKEMPHGKTLEMMELMDGFRNEWGVVYPFETKPSEVWDRSKYGSLLQVYDLEKDEVRLLHKFDSIIEAPNWDCKGKFLTYNQDGKIYKYELESGNITEVPSYYVDNCNNDHVLSSDGEGLYVSHHTKEDGISRIYKIFFNGESPELVTPLGPSYLHGISPDGSLLSYCACRNGEYDIYTIPSKGGVEKRLTHSKYLNDGPEYDGTGKFIWFNSARTGRMQVYRMKADGSRQEQMTFDAHFHTWFPHESPDGKKVVMLAYHERDVRPQEHVPNKFVELRIMELVGDSWSKPRTLLKLFGGQGTINVNSWSCDSKCFAFVSYEKL